MRAVSLDTMVEYLDGYLDTPKIPDYDGALNGLQVANGGELEAAVLSRGQALRRNPGPDRSQAGPSSPARGRSRW